MDTVNTKQMDTVNTKQNINRSTQIIYLFVI